MMEQSVQHFYSAAQDLVSFASGTFKKIWQLAPKPHLNDKIDRRKDCFRLFDCILVGMVYDFSLVKIDSPY